MIEIAVGLAIFSILTTMLFTSFKGGLDLWRRSENLLDAYQSSRAVLAQMSREISSAVIFQSSSNASRRAPFYGIDETGSRIKASSAKDEIFFVAPVENEGDMDLCEIGYWLDSTDNGLKRHFQKFDSADDLPVTYDFTTQDRNTKVAENATNLQLTYYYRSAAANPPTATTNSWNSTQNVLTNYDAKGNDKNPDGLPDAVGISITVQEGDPINPSSPKTWIFSTIVTVEDAK